MKEELFYKRGFLGFKITANDDCHHEIKTLAPRKKSYEKSRQCIYKQRHHLADKIPHSKSYGLSSSHVWVWELDHKEGWVPKNWCFWTVPLEKTHKSHLNCKEIKPINPKGNQPEDSLKELKLVVKLKLQFFGPLMWRPDSVGKNCDSEKYWGKKDWSGWQRMRWLHNTTYSMNMVVV